MTVDFNQPTVIPQAPQPLRVSEEFESEAQLETALLAQLVAQGYERVALRDEAALLANLRAQLEALNAASLPGGFTNGEWQRLLDTTLAKESDGIVEKTTLIQKSDRCSLRRDDGSMVNVTLIDKADLSRNKLQVTNQYAATGERANRYDVTILVNGLPLVHLELKRRGSSLREAFNQIERYQRESFGSGAALFGFVQLFVISNGTETKYYSNTTRKGHLREQTDAKGPKTSHSFEFTSYWTDQANNRVSDLTVFAQTFLSPVTLLKVLTRYCVLTAENLLLVMRPYQIAACEAILRRVEEAAATDDWGQPHAGGYVWHTTGSGKTLTSFKVAQLVKDCPGVAKVLFVVDRKDLDYQTIREYNRFAEGSANSNANTAVLARQLGDPTCRVIVTTIQKLSRFVRGLGDERPEVLNQPVVMIFDECHRSQLGRMHDAIRRAFTKLVTFGFTGTPIFDENALDQDGPVTTTEARFGRCLHRYNIVDAIADGNVLKFKVDFASTAQVKENVADEKVRAIDEGEVLAHPDRVKAVVADVLKHFDRLTRRNMTYDLKGQRVRGFNAMMALSSIPLARAYYDEFARQLADSGRELTVATIFSAAPNAEADETQSAEGMAGAEREFLARVIGDYNSHFGTNFDVTPEESFQNYYRDLSQRVKNREVDLLLVVNMFLTGFDATTLNTLFVDKNLQYHGLVQAFSRTNRILNSVKTHGHILCYRNLDQACQDAFRLFGGEGGAASILVRSYSDFMNGYDEGGKHYPGYKELTKRLKKDYPLKNLDRKLASEKAQKEFVKLFGQVLRMRNVLKSFVEFKDGRHLTSRERQDYESYYLDVREQRRKEQSTKTSVVDDLCFEVELIRQDEIGIDYIRSLLNRHAEEGTLDDEAKEDLYAKMDSSLGLRSKRKLIEAFVEKVLGRPGQAMDWDTFVRQHKDEALDQIIASENLWPDRARDFVDRSLRNGTVQTAGSEFAKLLKGQGLFGDQAKKRQESKARVAEKLNDLVATYHDAIDW